VLIYPAGSRVCRGLVTARDAIEAALARGGGQAVIIEPAMAADEEQYDALE
jgi:hypothetical protein